MRRHDPAAPGREDATSAPRDPSPRYREGAALLVGAAPPLPTRHRRLLRGLLAEGEVGGGHVLERPGGDLLLAGAGRGTAERIAALIAAVFGAAVPIQLRPLPEASEAVAAWAAAARGAAPPADPPTLPSDLEARIAGLPLPDVLRAAPLLRHRPGRADIRLGRRWRLSRQAIAAALGDPDGTALPHALDALAARLPAHVRGESASVGDAAGAALLPLPLHAPHVPQPPLQGCIAVLPLAAASDPSALAARRAGLAAAGWRLALEGLDAQALDWLEPAALPADLLLLRWSPALEARHARTRLRGADPLRWVVEGCDEAGLAWAASLGLQSVTRAA